MLHLVLRAAWEAWGGCQFRGKGQYLLTSGDMWRWLWDKVAQLKIKIWTEVKEHPCTCFRISRVFVRVTVKDTGSVLSGDLLFLRQQVHKFMSDPGYHRLTRHYSGIEIKERTHSNKYSLKLHQSWPNTVSDLPTSVHCIQECHSNHHHCFFQRPISCPLLASSALVVVIGLLNLPHKRVVGR